MVYSNDLILNCLSDFRAFCDNFKLVVVEYNFILSDVVINICENYGIMFYIGTCGEHFHIDFVGNYKSIKNRENMNLLIPIDVLLNYFVIYEYGEGLYRYGTKFELKKDANINAGFCKCKCSKLNKRIGNCKNIINIDLKDAEHSIISIKIIDGGYWYRDKEIKKELFRCKASNNQKFKWFKYLPKLQQTTSTLH